MALTQTGSVIPDEVARFNRLAAEWWDPAGPMRALHGMNEVRVGWIDARIRARLGGAQRVLDLGCGAGLAAEALAGLGHDVLGVDAAADAIAAARVHAEGQGLTLAYREGTAEALADEGARFPVVTALEVIEHVADPAAFLRVLARLMGPGGLLFVSTLNRTLRSLAVAKVGAEYVLRLLPAGTHDWRRFLTPAELGRAACQAGLRLKETAGMSYDLRRREWVRSADLSINYLAMLERTAE
ncbi:MAG TPA: bifunctional 2-polyprenyl-6-hydroxyphenol methylase/3-demethylubiquinol 3-O-methyltransferase UbiG [Acetobacteraceae bacterium]|nr:bifunctional 2-polyprenyl-6-hydroxyphenol methylase/3-demethylubiquinol 3-O-methyltransferase UbiG [Acetobacteraceae bacterium]